MNDDERAEQRMAPRERWFYRVILSAVVIGMAVMLLPMVIAVKVLEGIAFVLTTKAEVLRQLWARR